MSHHGHDDGDCRREQKPKKVGTKEEITFEYAMTVIAWADTKEHRTIKALQDGAQALKAEKSYCSSCACVPCDKRTREEADGLEKG